MKKIKYFFPFLFLFIFIFSLTVNAEDKPLSYATVDITNGETFYYYFEWQNGTEYQYQLADEMVYTGSKKLALYVGGGDYPMWIRSNDTNVYIPSFRSYTSMETCTSYGSWPIGNGTAFTTLVPGKFETNIPVFESADLATQYSNGTIGIEKALNYKKTYENGSWVRPFEDIEINDSDMLVPALSNISHTGFTVTNCNDERYLIEIYMKSGFATPEAGMASVTTIDDALYVNNYGLITDNSEAYWNGPTIDIAQLYGIDNISDLTDSYTNFYTTYPSANSYGIDASRDDTYVIWGHPFGKNEWFYTNNTEVSSSDLIGKTPYDFDLCFTNYRVRYFYYDDNSGFHYGPWCDVVYFSSGYVTQSAIFQSNTGNIIETPITSGMQSADGNISYDSSEFIDLGDVNGLFGNIRSIFNNISATNGTFSQLFASVFNFLPPEILGIIFGGIVLMVFIGIVKACIG